MVPLVKAVVELNVNPSMVIFCFWFNVRRRLKNKPVTAIMLIINISPKRLPPIAHIKIELFSARAADVIV